MESVRKKCCITTSLEPKKPLSLTVGVSSRAKVRVSSEADSAVHFQLQQRWGLLKVNSGLVTLLRGRGRGGGEYTVPEVSG
ncbi:hypothetical protein EYF80_042010 [Liparis tanakae]|uniref:Uncharacterized protein n=1 Tax=Liparis tanakae TaxID=230148 RepID=A0A4Z2G4J5_9TELE|nr:hypothetical protein EYF80_042010 [Liparis tanakae]